MTTTLTYGKILGLIGTFIYVVYSLFLWGKWGIYQCDWGWLVDDRVMSLSALLMSIGLVSMVIELIIHRIGGV